MRRRLSLDTAVNVLLALTCLVVMGKFAHDWRHRAQAAPGPAPHSLRPGTRVEGLNAIDWKDRNVVLFARSTCRYCTESMDFYRDLRAKTRATDMRFVVAGDEQSDQLKRYFSDNGISPDEVVSAAPPVTGVFATPTLAIVDRQGKVIESWVGKLSTDIERKVLSMLAYNPSS